MPTKPIEWINALFAKHAPLTKHQLILLWQGKLRACVDINALPANAAPREDYILKSHPLSMSCFRSKAASGDKWYFENLKKDAAAGNRKAKADLDRRTARLTKTKADLFKWISGLPEVIASGENAEDIYLNNFPEHTSVDDLERMMTEVGGIAVCKTIIFNPFAGMLLDLPPAVEEVAPAPAPDLPPAVEEVYYGLARLMRDDDDHLFEREITPEDLTKEVDSLRTRVDEYIASLPPAVEEGTFSDWPVYTNAELEKIPDERKREAWFKTKLICEFVLKGKNIEELSETPPGFTLEVWVKLVNTYINTYMDQRVRC